jgi:hypothetical protein
VALGSAYATADQYRERVGNQASGADSTLDAELLAASRLLDRSLGQHDGALNSHSATYEFDGDGGPVLWLRDRGGRQYLLRSVGAGGITLDTNRTGAYDGYSLDFDDAWVRGLPENAVALGRPFTAIELLGHITSAEPTRWVAQRGLVRITSTAWGWAAVPESAVELTVHLAHDTREGHRGGATLSAPTIDDAGLSLQSESWRLWKAYERSLTHRLPVVA